ncbi:SoxR reducing system RseC family protein [Psychromonas sp.]|uniref:SoxR reducing system RseC family protein n=1 Tax=Psychromonas sp. TaxID=1884585 RepID=UPI00356B45F6
MAVEKVNGKSIAHIECVSKSACSSCQNNSNCGVGVVSKTFSDKTQHFTVPYEEGMEVDKFVELHINNNDLIKSAVLVYLVPLIFFISSALIAKQLQIDNEALIILIAMACAAVGLAITRIISKKIFPQKHINQIITSKFIK